MFFCLKREMVMRLLGLSSLFRTPLYIVLLIFWLVVYVTIIVVSTKYLICSIHFGLPKFGMSCLDIEITRLNILHMDNRNISIPLVVAFAISCLSASRSCFIYNICDVPPIL